MWRCYTEKTLLMSYHNYYYFLSNLVLWRIKIIFLLWFICLIYLLKTEVQSDVDYRSFIVLTCEVAQAELPQAVVSVPSVVEEDGQRIATLVEFGASDDPQVLQRQIVELVESHQHVAGHFSDWLHGNKKKRSSCVSRLFNCVKMFYFPIWVLLIDLWLQSLIYRAVVDESVALKSTSMPPNCPYFFPATILTHGIHLTW